MKGKELKKVIESTGLMKGSIASAMGISLQALNQFYRTVDLRQETINKIDDAIRVLTNGEKSLYDFMPPADTPSDDASFTDGTILCDPLPPITPSVMEKVKSQPLPASGGSSASTPVPCITDEPVHEQNIIEVYARVISDIERMHADLARELSEVRALKSDLQRLVSSLSSSQMSIAADPIIRSETD